MHTYIYIYIYNTYVHTYMYIILITMIYVYAHGISTNTHIHAYMHTDIMLHHTTLHDTELYITTPYYNIAAARGGLSGVAFLKGIYSPHKTAKKGKVEWKRGQTLPLCL